jgi:5-methylthioadenosine/S-adenosylhomocysteine deaminase
LAEAAFVRDGAGTFAESHRKREIPIVPRRCTPIAYLNSLGILGPDMLLVHAIEADVSDLEEIRKTATSVAHCPKSNSWLGHRVAPVAAMRDRGIPVCLGTDSVASNDAFDMFAEMRAVVSQQHLGYEEVFHMATLEGARALGLEKHVGSLEPGKRADFNIVALDDFDGDPLESVIRFARPHDTKATFLGGREVVLDLEAARAEVRRIQLELSVDTSG